MDTSNLQLTPEMRAALSADPAGIVHIADRETRKIYLLLEQGAYPEIEEFYIREGLEAARGQIARGEISTASVDEIVSKAEESQRAKL